MAWLVLLIFSLTCIGAVATPIAAAAQSVIDTYVGGGSGDGAPAIDSIIDPRGVVVVGDPQRPDLYIADGKNNRVRHVSAATGLIDTIAGTGVAGFSGDGGNAQSATLRFPLDVAVDGGGNVYIVDLFNNRIRKVTPAGQISTFAGNGVQTFNGDGLATQASLSNPYGVTVGPDGYVYIADFGNNRVRKVGPPGCAASSCVMTTVAGNGNWGYSGDNGQATAAALRSPSDMVFDSAGNMYIADWGNNRIRRVAPNGIITSVAGGGQFGPGGTIGDGGPALLAVLNGPVQVAVDSANNLYIADSNQHRIRMLSNQTITTVAGTGGSGSGGDGGAPTAADLYATWGVAATTAGTFWLSQTTELPISLDNRVRRVDNYQVIRSVVGGGLGSGGAAIDALVDPRGTEAVDRGGAFPDLYFADGFNNVVRHVDGTTGIIETIAGTGVAGYSGDGGSGLNATLHTPLDVAYDANSAAVYVADTFNNVIRQISRSGVITTVAGDGNWGYLGDGGAATRARFASPYGIDVDSAGNLFIADYENNRVRKVSGGIVTTVAGNGNWGYGGDGGPATAATLRNPSDVLVGGDGSLYIADTQNNRIRRVSPAGIITTYAGNGSSGFGGDGGLAVLAKLNIPTTLALDGGGNLYIGDSQNNRVRRVDAIGLTIQTVAGNGQVGPSGDGGSPLAASFSLPTGVGVSSNGGMLFIGSKDDHRIRIVASGGVAVPTSTPPATATFTPTATWTSIPSTPTRTPTITQTPTRTGTATKTNTPGASGAVSGHVTYYMTQGNVPNVEVDLSGPITATVQTNPNGTYSVSGIPQGTLNLVPKKLGGGGGAVSSLDAARVLQVIAGLQSFTGLQRVACDVTGDGSLSALDAVRILQFSAGVIDRMPVAQTCNSDWIFYPSPDPPGQAVAPVIADGICQQGSIVVDPAGGSVPNQDFNAILFGDCTGNWSVSNGGALRMGAVVHTGFAQKVRGGRVRVPIYVQTGAPFQALDLAVTYDAGALRFGAARPRGVAAEALVSVNDATPGHLTISLASGTPLGAGNGAVLSLEFVDGHGACGDVRLSGAKVDEQAARVVNHDRCR